MSPSGALANYYHPQYVSHASQKHNGGGEKGWEHRENIQARTDEKLYNKSP